MGSVQDLGLVASENLSRIRDLASIVEKFVKLYVEGVAFRELVSRRPDLLILSKSVTNLVSHLRSLSPGNTEAKILQILVELLPLLISADIEEITFSFHSNSIWFRTRSEKRYRLEVPVAYGLNFVICDEEGDPVAIYDVTKDRMIIAEGSDVEALRAILEFCRRLVRE